MILFYTFALIVLGAIHWVLARRSASWGRAYSALAERVLKQVHGAPRKMGNGAYDPCAVAKQQFELGRLVMLRDRAEAKHFGWQTWAERFGKAVARLRAWKGRKLPYTLGALDVWLAMYLVDRFGPFTFTRQAIDAVTAWFTN